MSKGSTSGPALRMYIQPGEEKTYRSCVVTKGLRITWFSQFIPDVKGYGLLKEDCTPPIEKR